AGDDDARLRVVAPRLADRLLGLPHRLAGDGAGVDDDRSAFQCAKPRRVGFAAHDFRLIGIEPAAGGDDLHRLPTTAFSAPRQAPVAGSKRPENSHSAGPVMMT